MAIDPFFGTLAAGGLNLAGQTLGRVLSPSPGQMFSAPFHGTVLDAKSISVHPTILNTGVLSANDPSPNLGALEPSLSYVFGNPAERVATNQNKTLLIVAGIVAVAFIFLQRK